MSVRSRVHERILRRGLGWIKSYLARSCHNKRSRKLLTIRYFPGEIRRVKITRTGQVTIPPAMRRKHGLLACAEVKLVDQPDGVLVVKAATNPRGKRVLATLLRGGKIKSRTKDWLRLTRG